MVNFDTLIISDIIEYKTKEEKCKEYIKRIDLDYTIYNTFYTVINNIVEEINEEIITDLYLTNVDTYTFYPLKKARMRRKYARVKDDSKDKFIYDYDNHGILINHNLVNTLIRIYDNISGCTVERLYPIYSGSSAFVFKRMEGVAIHVNRQIHYTDKTIEEYNNNSSVAYIRREMLRKCIDGMKLGIDDISSYLDIDYPIKYILDDMFLNPDIVKEYNINM